MKLTLSKSLAAVLLSTVALIAGGLVWKTNADLLALPTFLSTDGFFVRKVQVTDRNYQPLTVTYQNRWNLHDHIPLHDIPQFLQQAFVVSEDQRFYRHKGVDWAARLHAIYQNIKVLDSIRGARSGPASARMISTAWPLRKRVQSGTRRPSTLAPTQAWPMRVWIA